MAGDSRPPASHSCSWRAVRPVSAATSREPYVFFNRIGNRVALRARRGFWPTRANLVEPDACGLERIERLSLQLDGARRGRARDGAAGDGAMICALGELQLLEGGGMFALPLEPARHTIQSFGLVRAAALDAKRVAGGLALRVREPLSVALGAHQAIPCGADRYVFHVIHGPAEAGHYRSHGPAEAGHYRSRGPAEAGRHVRGGRLQADRHRSRTSCPSSRGPSHAIPVRLEPDATYGGRLQADRRERH